VPKLFHKIRTIYHLPFIKYQKNSSIFQVYSECEDNFLKESQCFTQLLCKRISRKASHAFSLYTVIRSLEKNVNALPNCFALEFQEKHPMLFPYIR